MNLPSDVNFLNGLISLPWWGYLVVGLVLTHITIASVTLFLHRAQAHRGLDLHPIMSHFFRFWLWISTGIETREWVAIHRKHHAKCETADDPHSPQHHGIKKVLLDGYGLYWTESQNPETIAKYSHGMPDDWLEHNLYEKYSWQGVALLLITHLILFGPIGATIWAVQMAWIPFHAAGIINGIGHYWGYRHYTVNDTSRNIVPIAFWIGGEELHNNHHAFPTSARFSMRWYEFDLGWAYIRTLSMLGLAEVKKVAPRPRFNMNKVTCDVETVHAVIAHRYEIITKYAGSLKETYAAEIAKLRANGHVPALSSLREKVASKHFRNWLRSDANQLTSEQHATLAETFQHSRVLELLYKMRQELAQLWERSTLTAEELVAKLEDWCRRAEASGIEALQEFALRLRSYA